MSLSREEIGSSLAELDAALLQIESLLKPITGKALSETTKDMTPLENAKLQVTLAYTMNTLFYMYMKLQNANMVGHAIVKDMERLKGYMKKLQAAEATAVDGPTLKLNKAAAKRFIQGALSQANQEDKTTSEAVEESKDCSSDSSDKEEEGEEMEA